MAAPNHGRDSMSRVFFLLLLVQFVCAQKKVCSLSWLLRITVATLCRAFFSCSFWFNLCALRRKFAVYHGCSESRSRLYVARFFPAPFGSICVRSEESLQFIMAAPNHGRDSMSRVFFLLLLVQFVCAQKKVYVAIVDSAKPKLQLAGYKSKQVRSAADGKTASQGGLNKADVVKVLKANKFPYSSKDSSAMLRVKLQQMLNPAVLT